MTSKRKPYKTYTSEFKIEAVRLMAESDRPSSELAVELGRNHGAIGLVGVILGALIKEYV